MAYVLNKKSGMIQRFSNPDVLRQLSHDDGYVVADTPEACQEAMAKKAPEKPLEAVKEEPVKVPEKKAEPAVELIREKLEGMKVKELRAVAKDKGIQAYSNMDKATLVEVILAY